MNKKIVLGLIGVVAVIGIGIAVASHFKKGPETYDKEKWTNEYAKAVATSVQVNFEPIKTGRDEYDRLSQSCNDYIQKFEVERSADVQKKKAVNLKTETGPLYYQNMLMQRYTDGEGKLKIATSAFDVNREFAISQLGQEEVGPFFGYEQISYTDNGKLPMSEETYIRNVTETVKELLEATEPSQQNKAEKMAIQVFTIDGREGILKIKDTLKLEDSKFKVAVNYAAACKTDIGLNTKDRVYMQMLVEDDEGKTELVNIIMKLNRYNKIFDIDIV